MARIQIFLTDDDDDDRLLIRAALSGMIEDVDVIESTSGEALLQNLSKTQNLDIPALILMDMNMPMMTGLEALAEIRARVEYRHIPVILISTTSTDSIIKQAFALGVNAFIEKPIMESDFVRLARSVQICLSRHLGTSAATPSGPEEHIALVGDDVDSAAALFQTEDAYKLAENDHSHISDSVRSAWNSFPSAPSLVLVAWRRAVTEQDLDAIAELIGFLNRTRNHYIPVVVLKPVVFTSHKPVYDSLKLRVLPHWYPQTATFRSGLRNQLPAIQ